MTTIPLPQTDYDIYARELWSLGHGHPMWGPEPSPAFGQVRLGDVGYLREGDFSFLFNCMLDAHDPINKRGVPDAFEPFVPPSADSIQFRPDKITQRQLHSGSISSLAFSVGASMGDSSTALATAALRYQCKRTSGALLLLQENAHKWFLDCDRQIKEYMAAQIEGWHTFASVKLGIDVAQEGLIFVSGYTKTTLWAVAAFNGSDAQGELVISGGWPTVASADFSVSMSRSVDTSVFSRTGPSYRLKAISPTSFMSRPDTTTADQCIFLNYYKAKKRRMWQPQKVMKAAAGSDDLDSEDDDNDTSDLVSCGDEGSVSSASASESEWSSLATSFSPVDHLLDYMLINSNADTVCASDKDMTRLFADMHFPNDWNLAFKGLRISISPEGWGSVNPECLEDQRARGIPHVGPRLEGGRAILQSRRLLLLLFVLFIEFLAAFALAHRRRPTALGLRRRPGYLDNHFGRHAHHLCAHDAFEVRAHLHKSLSWDMIDDAYLLEGSKNNSIRRFHPITKEEYYAMVTCPTRWTGTSESEREDWDLD